MYCLSISFEVVLCINIVCLLCLMHSPRSLVVYANWLGRCGENIKEESRYLDQNSNNTYTCKEEIFQKTNTFDNG